MGDPIALLDCNSITDTYIIIIMSSAGSLVVVTFLAVGLGCVAAFQPSLSNVGVNQRSISALEMGFGNEYIPSGFTKAR